MYIVWTKVHLDCSELQSHFRISPSLSPQPATLPRLVINGEMTLLNISWHPKYWPWQRSMKSSRWTSRKRDGQRRPAIQQNWSCLSMTTMNTSQVSSLFLLESHYLLSSTMDFCSLRNQGAGVIWIQWLYQTSIPEFHWSCRPQVRQDIQHGSFRQEARVSIHDWILQTLHLNMFPVGKFNFDSIITWLKFDYLLDHFLKLIFREC